MENGAATLQKLFPQEVKQSYHLTLPFFSYILKGIENIKNLCSRSVVSHSLWPHGLQHTRLPCPSPTPRAYSNSCPSSRWWYPTIPSSVVPFSSCLQSFPASGSFPKSQFFASGGPSIGVSASASVLPMNIQDWLPLLSTAAAKSLQSWPTLCDPIDGSPPGSPIPGILKARTLEWVATSFSSAWKWKMKVKSLSHVQLSAIPWTAAYQAPPSMGFARQEYWSGLPLAQYKINKKFKD